MYICYNNYWWQRGHEKVSGHVASDRLLRLRKVRAWEDRLFERLAGRILHQTATNSVLLLDHIGTDSIAQVTLREVPEYLRDNKTICGTFQAKEQFISTGEEKQ